MDPDFELIAKVRQIHSDTRAMVVSVEEKSRHKIAAGRTQRDERKRTIR